MQWDYAFDFGSDSVRFAKFGSKQIYSETPYAAFTRGADAPFAWGDNALGYKGREGGNITLKTCFEGGVPLDPVLTAGWIRRIISLTEKRPVKRERVLVALSGGANAFETEALLKEITSLAADTCGVVDSGAASALGALEDTSGSAFMLDAGGSQTTFTAVVGGRSVKTLVRKQGLRELDAEIISAVRLGEGLCISSAEARRLKHIAYLKDSEIVTAFDCASGFPREKQISTRPARQAISKYIAFLAETLAFALEGLPKALAGDVINSGVTLTGGAAGIDGIEKALCEVTEIDVKLPQNAKNAVILGLQTILEVPEAYAHLIYDWKGADTIL